ncbi:39S ribosomal protein L3, mitochondrial [Eurytemora carolleeae]|uniref:39S ribosomal protein L3, mitochondrial n=1 Tax=Eurytemora carolleeae TaxID=1294199 RepID=UPI000C78A7BD|nr:39S ribosomal protein L3, mitochondrial [Eurytemora carolleeae]|eukprot:XP_023336994.1 39S ribosomal protein L3, mitochondrial-like [Eurytemora affinis]
MFKIEMFTVRSLLSLANQPSLLPGSALHTSSTLESRIKRVNRHKPFWQSRKLNKATDEPISAENKMFIQNYIDKKYAGPLREEFTPWAKGSWKEGTRRPGVLAVKIGVQPIWLKNGKQIITTLLHVQDNHVIKFTTRSEYEDSYVGEKNRIANYTGSGNKKGDHITGLVTVGAVSTDPQKYTKDYCGLFSESGVMPKRHLARFPVTENGIIQPGTPLSAAHFTPGQFVDVYGRTMERGFHGVMKRWGFAGMPASHGVTKSHRRAGHIGSGCDKSRVWPGQKMPGNIGGRYTWLRGLRIWRINYEENVLYVSGTAVQGNTGSILQVCDTKLKSKRWGNEKIKEVKSGPRFFPTASQEDIDKLPEEEYCDLVHDFNAPSISRV